jgi:ankyrin repeat protein
MEETPLHAACDTDLDTSEIIELLLAHGAEINAKNQVSPGSPPC